MARRKRIIEKKRKATEQPDEELQDVNEVQGGEDDVLVDLVHTTEEAQDFIEKHQGTIFGALVAVVLLVGGWLAYKNFYVQPKQEAALEQMWVAENQFAQDSFALAINNPGGGNLGFAEIADDYGVATASNAASYYTAVGYLNLGKYDDAIAYLNKVSGDGQLLPILKNGLLGDAYSEKGDLDSALGYYKKATSSDNEVMTPYYLRKLGMLNEKQGNKADAHAAYLRIRDNYPNTNYGREIEKYLSRTAQ